MPPRILIAEDEDRLRRLFAMLLSNAGYKMSLAEDGEQALEMFGKSKPDVVLTDMRMPKMDGMTLLKKIKEVSPETPVIVITAYGAIEDAVEAMKAGAEDYLTKPIEEEQLKISIEKALKLKEILTENVRLRAEKKKEYDFPNIIAESKAMKDLLQMAAQVAKADATVLIYGESGTGKELVARAIHLNSPRSRGPFEPINCAAIPDNLLESELFGYERGAFTGAVDAKPGVFELASNGTLFLDEIGDMAFALQAKVLRALEERTFKRLGGSKTIQTNTRFVAATNRNISEMVRNGQFREDLFYRLSVFPLEILPLRRRTEDIFPLARHFLARFCRQMGKPVPEIGPDAERFLLTHTWPGNVRELQNVIERAVILLNSRTLTVDVLGQRFGSPDALMGVASGKDNGIVLPNEGFDLEEHVRGLIDQAMARSKGNKSAAAKMLGISRATLRYRIEKYGLEGDVEDGKDDEEEKDD
ncbi:MAG: sigma-54 dependent transcriptional regulator [Candidatus Sumerlaeota bacterium]|nr:sigma-54 dependent transcriptional regulator [Candidatus Sumerlaeota bacterium]